MHLLLTLLLFFPILKGTSPGGSDVVATTDVTEALLGSGAVCHGGGLSLLHNTTYYSTLYITNGAITNYTTTLYTNGIPIYFPSNYYTEHMR